MVQGLETDYARLAGAELDAAGVSADQVGRDYHLNRAAVFAFLGDSLAQGRDKTMDIAAIRKVLGSTMALVDAIEAPVVAIHIDSAIVALDQYSHGLVA